MKDPLVIGALGGSGTRIVARIVRHTGFFIGNNLNKAEDAMEFVDFYDCWINRYVQIEKHSMIDHEKTQMDADFFSCVSRHRAGISYENVDWGWKEPRSIYLLPFFHKHYLKMKFIHVIRDGRDMAFSSNQNQLGKHGTAILGVKYTHLQQPVRTALLWNKINVMAAEYGEKNMGENYLRVRFEDLCNDPKTIVNKINDFVNSKREFDLQNALKEVQRPESLGRWQHFSDSDLIRDIHVYAREALVRFGYCQESELRDESLSSSVK